VNEPKTITAVCGHRRHYSATTLYTSVPVHILFSLFFCKNQTVPAFADWIFLFDASPASTPTFKCTTNLEYLLKIHSCNCKYFLVDLWKVIWISTFTWHFSQKFTTNYCTMYVQQQNLFLARIFPHETKCMALKNCTAITIIRTGNQVWIVQIKSSLTLFIGISVFPR